MNLNKIVVVIFFALALITNASGMNKAELIDAIASDANLSKADAKRSLDGFVTATSEALKKGDRVALIGFGTFSISARAARKGRNPQTGATIQIKAKKVKEVEFDIDRPLAEATYPIFLQNFWADFNTANAQNIRGMLNNGHVNILRSAEVKAKVESVARGDVPTQEGFFNIILSLTQAVGNSLSSENANLMLRADSRRAYADFLLKSIGNPDIHTAAHEAAHVVQQRQGKNIQSAVEALSLQAAAMEVRYLDSDDDGDSVPTDERKSDSGGVADGSEDQNKSFKKSFVKVVTAALKKGDRVALVGFGSFSISRRAARTGRNPQTGKEIKIAAKNVVRFKAGADLSKKVN